jgi:hypothetical protein
MARKKKENNTHEDIKGFNISINQFGEIVSTMPIDRLNAFLNQQPKAEEKIEKAAEEAEEEKEE